jgi:hypothetical protein
MSVLHPGLFSIMQRFPSEKAGLRRLYTSSQSFQTLCDDYQKCTEALAYWRQSGQDQALERSREYEELRQGLEEEIKERIGIMQ